MSTIDTEIAEFRKTVEVWRAVGVTSATRQGAARRATLIADELQNTEIARQWRQVAALCLENHCHDVVEICMTLVPQTLSAITGVDPDGDDPNEGESFDAFMIRTVYAPAWERGEYPDLGDV